jgi:hypothetical protein
MGRTIPLDPWYGSYSNKVNATDVLVHGLGVPFNQIKQGEWKEVIRCLRHDGYKSKRDGPRRYVWYHSKGQP